MSNNHKNSCQFAEQIVSYLYDEFESKEKIEFETHLKNCSFCTDEYVGFGFVRSSVLEWRNAEFSNLEVPTFAVQENEKVNFSPLVSTVGSSSLFDQLRQMFSFNPVLATATLAVAIVGIGIAVLALNFSGSSEIAKQPAEKEIVQSKVSPTNEITKKAIVADKINESASPQKSEVNDLSKEIKSSKTIEPEKTVVKVSAAPKNNINNSIVIPKETIDKKPSPVSKQRVPNLNELDQDEDETIRLADLFDELDTK